jgi:hypothetical protein
MGAIALAAARSCERYVSRRVRPLLKLNEMETLQPGPDSKLIIARLMELT